MRLFGLIGYPLSHSFSKQYFTDKFAREGLTDCRFENFSIATIDELPQLINHHPDLEGIAVTIPYKKAVLKFVDDSTAIPEEIKACNCIKFKDRKLLGFNTDYLGLEKSILPFLKPHHQKALVLGNGGAKTAVEFVLNKLAIQHATVSRQIHDNATYTYEDVTEEIITEHTLIINTTPLGMFPHINTYPDIPYQFINGQHLLFDLVYNPAKTLFLQKGAEHGATIKNGMEMLEIQAEENWRIWNE